MDNENYIVINGEKAELTEEQLKVLGIEAPKKSVFDRPSEKDAYYYIDPAGDVCKKKDLRFGSDDNYYAVANYCTDRALMEQRALHETLDRLLWRFSMEHDGDKIDWDVPSKKYRIYCDECKSFLVSWDSISKSHTIYFHTRNIAERAIEEIIKPFMAEHPEFRW